MKRIEISLGIILRQLFVAHLICLLSSHWHITLLYQRGYIPLPLRLLKEKEERIYQSLWNIYLS